MGGAGGEGAGPSEVTAALRGWGGLRLHNRRGGRVVAIRRRRRRRRRRAAGVSPQPFVKPLGAEEREERGRPGPAQRQWKGAAGLHAHKLSAASSLMRQERSRTLN